MLNIHKNVVYFQLVYGKLNVTSIKMLTHSHCKNMVFSCVHLDILALNMTSMEIQIHKISCYYNELPTKLTLKYLFLQGCIDAENK